MSDDEYAEYDLSEFTEQDFAFMDAIAKKQIDILKGNASPALQIELELDHHLRDKIPFQFVSWKKSFSVTDLVSPIWCEVQFEYGLYGRRNRPLEKRPSSFTSKNGKVINVQHDIAQSNDRRLQRGKSVHQALEEELRPVKAVVHPVSAEDRFGLRLVQLIDGFRELTLNGITRELPVFTITHGQVVQGVIDEITHSANVTTSSLSDSPRKKKQRRSPSPSQNELSCGSNGQGNTLSISPDGNEANLSQERSKSDEGSTYTTNDNDTCELRIIDYKTRRSLSVPPDEETLSSRLQLMLYHRMLTSVLQPESFDFDVLWNWLDLDPMKQFSDQFLQDLWKDQLDIAGCPVNLSDLVQVWISAVRSERDRSGPATVSPQLQLVYRRSAFAGKQGNGKRKAEDTHKIDDRLEALQEEPELARAIEESLLQIGHERAAQMSEQAGFPSLCQTSDVWKEIFASTSSEQRQLELAIQESLLALASKKWVDTAEKTSSLPADTLLVDRSIPDNIFPEVLETTSAISPIIGTKEFAMDDNQLDAHLTDVLQWWFGARPARGVDASQTRRCSTCEYRGSCEWRERKAEEAAAIVSARKPHRGDATSA